MLSFYGEYKKTYFNKLNRYREQAIKYLVTSGYRRHKFMSSKKIHVKIYLNNLPCLVFSPKISCSFHKHQNKKVVTILGLVLQLSPTVNSTKCHDFCRQVGIPYVLCVEEVQSLFKINQPLQNCFVSLTIDYLVMTN